MNSPDPSLIRALQDAVDREPANDQLRLHLGEMLLQTGQAGDALVHFQAALSRNPADSRALGLAGKAARSAGQEALADGYEKLASALGWSSAQSLVDSAISEPMKQTVQGSPAPSEDFIEEFPTSQISLKDVAGMEEVKRRLEVSFLAPMRNPEMAAAFKMSLRGGLLLYGPPGCGKTYMARAIAGELMARFFSVSLTDVVDMYIGESEKNLHEIFESARRSRPCVLFFDEIDALGRKRSLTRDHAGRSVINQLLTELDGVDADNEGLFVLAATNHPWDVDSALRRPGRLDRTLLVLPPDLTARETILRMGLAGRPTGNLDLGWVAKQTEDFSGADLAHLVSSASELALEDSMKRGATRPIQTDDFKRSLKEVKPSIRTWLETARSYVQYANEGGVYDDLAAYLRTRKML